jgi:hypothetical protein
MSTRTLSSLVFLCACNSASTSAGNDADTATQPRTDSATTSSSASDATNGDTVASDCADVSTTSSTDVSTDSLPTDAPPGSNFDLSIWELQEPSNTTITSAQLQAGYTDSYFYTGSDGAMTFWDPETGIPTTNSKYPRCELREMQPDGTTQANWAVTGTGTNILSATLEVVEVPTKVVVGQIHIGSALGDAAASS